MYENDKFSIIKVRFYGVNQQNENLCLVLCVQDFCTFCLFKKVCTFNRQLRVCAFTYAVCSVWRIAIFSYIKEVC